MWDLHMLFVRHYREINRFLRRRGHNPETAAELTQDTFLRVLASPPGKASGDHNPRAYLYKVSRNLSANHQRRERLVQFTDLGSGDVERMVDPAPSPETVVYGRQCLAQTEQALAELPERTRKAFEMHRLGGLTIAQVAAEIGLSTTRTWALVREAYRHILDRVDDI